MSIKDTKRVFIAINLDQEIKKYIHLIQEEIIFCTKEDGTCKIKFVEGENLHISLKFLDELKPAEIEKTILILQKISGQFQSFKIKLLKSIGLFPNHKRPRVIWIGIEEGYQKIVDLYSAIEQKIVIENFYRKDKNFTAHITLGRVHCLKNSNNITECINKISCNKLYQTIQSIELMESNLTTKGPIYNVIKKFSLL